MTIAEVDMVASIHRRLLDGQRGAIIEYLIGRGFTPPAAAKATQNYIETQVFLVRETAKSQ